jgi:cation diffusion facilitator family transporter
VAGAANLFVAAIKVAAGIAAGSSALLAEAAHSIADTLDQAFLLASLRRSSRPANPRHPFGYGQERYFYSLLAAFGIFLAGAGFSVFEGVLALIRPDRGGDVWIGYVVLVVAGAAEAISFLRALHQTRREARQAGQPLREHLRRSTDTTVKTALFEDSAAMVGLALAAAGIGLRQLTGSPVYDAAASIAIGGLLVVIAIRLGRDSKELLIGRAADEREQAAIREEIESQPGVDELLELLTMHIGPDHLIVAARVAFSDHISADAVEDLAERIDGRLAELLPGTAHVFVDPTDASRRDQEALLPGRG